MKINDIQRTGAINPYRKSSDDILVSSKENKQKKTDVVNISSEAKQLQSSTASKQQVEDLKKSYMTGTYHVEARQIAEKLFPYL
jgi:negative regulator of flagellin synthesis FlgM